MASKNISTKRKKKLWYGLYAPAALNNAFLGETHVYSPDELVGKSISLHLSMITGDMKKQNVITSFRVNKVEDNKGLTELTGYALSIAHIKRLVRRKRDKIDDSFLAKSKDDRVLRIKTVVMTNARTYDSANSAIRMSLRAKIRKELKEMSFEEFVNSIINLRLQKDWKSSLTKIYPIKFLEVRHISLENSKKGFKEEEDKDLTELIVSEEELDLDESEKNLEESEEDQEKEDVEDIEDDSEEDEASDEETVDVEEEPSEEESEEKKK